MATAQATPDAPRVDEDIIERGDWTKERHDLELTEAEFVADILRLQAERRERLATTHYST
jgi:hypothetical protein